MKEAIGNFFNEIVGPQLSVFICSMIPIIECRGAVPLGVLFNLPWWQTMLFSIVGNILPVPFILLFIRKFMEFAERSKWKLLNRTANWLRKKIEKHKGKIEKHSYWGVMLFVGIPLPGTGAWTGSLIAAMLDLEKKKTFVAALGGVVIATVIMTLVSYGVIGTVLSFFR